MKTQSKNVKTDVKINYSMHSQNIDTIRLVKAISL